MLPRLHSRRSATPLLALCLIVAAGCAATPRHRVDVWLGSDVPRLDERGRPLRGIERDAIAAELAWRAVAAYRCDGIEAAPNQPACPKEIQLDPVTEVVGPPPNPSAFAAQAARGKASSQADSDRGRSAFEQAVRERYRSYASHVAATLAGADSVEIGRASGFDGMRSVAPAELQRELAEAFDTMAVEYAALEWSRHEQSSQGRGRRGATSRPSGAKPPPSAAPAQGSATRPPSDPAAPVPSSVEASALEQPPKTDPEVGSHDLANGGAAPHADEENGNGRETSASTTRDETNGTVKGNGAAGEPAVQPIAAPGGGSPDVGCRRGCTLEFRTCLATCRGKPVEGGAYDACAYGCDARGGQCRSRCRTIAGP